jgi:hypothetical protein
MNLARSEVEGCGDQTQHTGKHKGRSNRFDGRKAGNQQKSWHGETASADSGEAHRESDAEANKQLRHCERSEKV